MAAPEPLIVPPARTGVAASAFPGKILLGLFAVVTFLNAALLFAVQPMFTKMVLPLLGGTPMVWNTCLLFFQAALLLGYLYAHASSQWLRPRSQGLVHIGLLLGALAFLPLSVPRAVVPPAGVALPVLWLLTLLAVSLGLPFVLLSAGAPMFQRWFATTRHPSADNPYVLYVASNLGSFVALLAYPTLIEPWLRVSEQSRSWLGIYYVLLGLVGLAWWMTARWARTIDSVGEEMVMPAVEGAATFPGGGAPPVPELHVAETSASPPVTTIPLTIVPTAAWRLRWVLLSFAPSSLLIGVTTYLSTDVAAVPLLWIVPLALYLLTFVIVFARQPLLNRRFTLDFQLFMGLVVLLIIGMTAMSLRVLALHLIGFFATALVCHRELADSRPQTRHLTEFYLWMSLGGMLGGVFNVIIAPLVYDRVLEYPFALIVAYGLRPAIGPYSTSRRAQLLDLALPLLLYGAMRAAFHIELPAGKWATAGTWTLLGMSALVASAFYKRPLRLALGAAAVFFAVDHREPPGAGLVYQDRSFFGVYRVHRWGEYLVLQHGTTTHGAQSHAPGRLREPLTYYHRGGPLGDVFATLTDTTAVRQVALVGLGAGTTACYAHAGEAWTFYEIDPAVVDIARSGRLFTYLRECAPDSRIVLGDARLSLVKASDSGFDLIVLDAFSSDAIPVHLLTREALALYLRKLKPGGAVAFHISNRYLDLEPVLVELARDAKLAGAVGNFDASQEDKNAMHYASRWVVLSREAATLAPLVKDRGWTVLAPSAEVRVWTDDFSDIVGILKH
jgi:spermidine synthase